MASFFGWQVHYVWGNDEVTVGTPTTPEKVIHIVDLSRGKSESQGYLRGFVLIISSANQARWHDISQQQTWSEVYGNFCFIDPATDREVEAIAANGTDNADEKEQLVANAQQTFKVAGGALRLCLQEENVVRKIVGETTFCLGRRIQLGG